MVSVNFDKNKDAVRKPVKPVFQKPSVIIDILDEEGPYRVIEPPTELVDIASDSEEPEKPELETEPQQTKAPEPAKESLPTEILGPKTPPNEPVAEHDDDEDEDLKSKPEPTPVKGPMTPPEPDSYDPFEPTDSPDHEDLAPETPPLQPETPPPATPESPVRPPSPPPNTIPFLSSPVNGGGPVTPEPPLLQPYTRKPLYTNLPLNVSATLPDSNR